MSWGVKYKSQITDLLGHVWITDMLEENYAGSITEVQSAGVPLEITTLGEGDDTSGIKAREWNITWNNATSFQFLTLFTGTSRSYMVNIYKDTVLVGVGWVDPENYSEEFICPVYSSTIHITDGLGELKNIFFDLPPNPTGSYTRTLMYYISAGLAMTGIELPIYVATDFTFQRKNGDTVNSNIFGNLTLDWRQFRTGEYNFWTWYDILSYILKSYEGLRLFQEAGAWWIERAGVQKTAQYDVDKYTTGGEFDSSVKKTAIIPLTSNAVAQPVRFGSGAELTLVPGWKRFKIVHEFGVKDNFLEGFNLEGNIFYDSWRTTDDLWKWSRSNVVIRKGVDNSFRITGFAYSSDLYPIFANHIRTDSVYVYTKETVDKLAESWGMDLNTYTGMIGMKLKVRYYMKKANYFSEDETLRLYVRVSLNTSNGLTINAYNNYTDPISGEHVIRDDGNAVWAADGSDPNVTIEIIPTLDSWTTYEVNIPNIAIRGTAGDPYDVEWWSFHVKIFQPVSDLSAGDPNTDGVWFSQVKLGFYDKNNPEGSREIEETAEDKNRFVPEDIQVKIASTPGHWGSDPGTLEGHEFMDRHIYLDLDGVAVLTWGTKSAGLAGDLLETVMKPALTLKHKLPLFKLRGSVRDNPDTMDFCSVLQDYDGRYYQPTGMTRNAGINEVQAEWIQERTPEQKSGGEFNWDFSNDFNI